MRDDYDHPSDWEPVKIKEDKMKIMTADPKTAPNWVKETPLIAAAPELLEALKAIASAFDCPRDRLGRLMNMQGQAEPLRHLAIRYDVAAAEDTMHQAMNVARAAIAKAEHGKETM